MFLGGNTPFSQFLSRYFRNIMMFYIRPATPIRHLRLSLLYIHMMRELGRTASHAPLRAPSISRLAAPSQFDLAYNMSLELALGEVASGAREIRV